MTKEEMEEKYNEVYPFFKERAAVKLNHKYGHINKEGEIVTPIIFDNVGSFGGNSSSFVIINGNYGKVDLDGNIIQGWKELIRGVFK